MSSQKNFTTTCSTVDHLKPEKLPENKITPEDVRILGLFNVALRRAFGNKQKSVFNFRSSRTKHSIIIQQNTRLIHFFPSLYITKFYITKSLHHQI